MGRDRLLWLLLAILLGGLLILALNHEQGEVAGLSLDQFGSLIYLAPLGLVVGAGILTMARRSLGETLSAIAFWLMLVAVLAVGYTYRDPLQRVAERVIGQLVPGYVIAVPGAANVVEVARGADGDFAVRVGLNDATVPMLLDTGASSVVLTQEAAQAAGIALDRLKYDVAVDTANGRTRAAAVTLDRVSIGSIVEYKVPALVAPAGMLRTPLLGMSFLSRLEGFEVRGDRLVLRGPGETKTR